MQSWPGRLVAEQIMLTNITKKAYEFLADFVRRERAGEHDIELYYAERTEHGSFVFETALTVTRGYHGIDFTFTWLRCGETTFYCDTHCAVSGSYLDRVHQIARWLGGQLWYLDWRRGRFTVCVFNERPAVPLPTAA